MRRHRVDSNQQIIVRMLRDCGYLVLDLSGCGVAGVPDLLCCHPRTGLARLLELKRPAGPRGGTAGRRLRLEQRAFALAWQQIARVVRSPAEAVAAMGYAEVRPRP